MVTISGSGGRAIGSPGMVRARGRAGGRGRKGRGRGEKGSIMRERGLERIGGKGRGSEWVE